MGVTRASVSPDIGGFAAKAFLETVHRHHPLGTWQAVEDGETFIPLVLHDGEMTFAGHEDLIDYRAPTGIDAVDRLAAALEARPEVAVTVDSLPGAAADVVEEAARTAGRTPTRAHHETTARLRLPGGFDEYLSGLSKKERHELRRKRRRYEEELGSVELVRESDQGPLVESFIELHRTARGDKGEFMTPQMADYFRDVLTLEGWHVDGLVDGKGRVTAASFAYEDTHGYYLYNSSYDLGLRHLSPGIVLLGVLIESAADAGLAIFDFLKGDEVYKYRLGAETRQLYLVTA